MGDANNLLLLGRSLSDSDRHTFSYRTSRFLASTSAPMLCPESTVDKGSSFTRPDSGKPENRKCIVKRAAIAELKVKEADTKLRELERQVEITE